MLDAQHLLGRIVLRLERAMQCLREPGGSGRLVAEPLQQLDDEGRCQAPVLVAAAVQDRNDALVIPFLG